MHRKVFNLNYPRVRTREVRWCISRLIYTDSIEVCTQVTLVGNQQVPTRGGCACTLRLQLVSLISIAALGRYGAQHQNISLILSSSPLQKLLGRGTLYPWTVL